MGVEIERKFLVHGEEWKNNAGEGTDFQQGYLSRGGDCSVRVRIEGNRANLNIKSATLGISRQEFEYPVPVADAKELLSLFCPATVIKKRYLINFAGKTWEIDVFAGDNHGLVIAEIELDSIDEKFQLPPWAGEEVSADPRYYNTELAKHPYNSWKKSTGS
jgi:adenylate cyclase